MEVCTILRVHLQSLAIDFVFEIIEIGFVDTAEDALRIICVLFFHYYNMVEKDMQ